ncbi:MAG: nucleoside-diphosphate sugar epimerase/dehydratase [Proteobacteria bacterium]|nr:nucleoside-diphosphate sugar epimerase/dehydratase [Pseudomonadota bacterium]
MARSIRGLRINRTLMVTAHDIVMAAASFVLAQLLRRGWENFWVETESYLLLGMLLFTGVAAAVFLYMRTYRGVWRYASLTDLFQITKAVTLAILIFLPLMFVLTRLETFPRSALVINWFVLLALLGGSRFLYRVIRYRNLGGIWDRSIEPRIPVLLVGAGDAAEVFIREMVRNPEAVYRVAGLVDDDARHHGRDIHGVRVMGRAEDLAEVVAKVKRRNIRPQKIILTSDEYTGDRLSRLLEAADELGMTVSRIGKLTDFRSGEAQGIETRPIAIEDLLGRPQTVLDREAMRALVKDKRVLVTGAGGTIGAELARQIAAYGPARISLLDNAEFNLYRIEMEIAGHHPELARTAILGDVRDRARLDQTFARERPELVFHAAAFKHVPMVEANPNEGVLTNVIGTRNVADACLAAGVGAMVLISTDKAVNPTSVMGATKRIAECYCEALGQTRAPTSGDTRLVTVRFGNVLGSTGSVVPLFERQIKAGGPVTVTDPEVTRYFMTVREAVELVLQASALGVAEAQASGAIFMLDMGRPVRIVDLARQMIRLAGLHPETDVKIEFTGLRPGEKLVEELFHESEAPLATPCQGILRSHSRPADLATLTAHLDRLLEAAGQRRTGETLALLATLVPEYRAGAAPEAERAAAT